MDKLLQVLGRSGNWTEIRDADGHVIVVCSNLTTSVSARLILGEMQKPLKDERCHGR